MPIYVDKARLQYGRMVMCHMVADSNAELLTMADRIGLSRRHIQEGGTFREHFDICQEKRALAVQHGAVELGRRDLAIFIRNRRAEQGGA